MARNKDPYAPPPRHRDHSGAFVRLIIMAALIGAAAWGYLEYSKSGSQTASLTPPVEQQTADAGYRVTGPETAPQATPPAPAAPQAAPRTPAPAEPVPPPSTTVGTPPAG